jgi:outer membrane protein
MSHRLNYSYPLLLALSLSTLSTASYAGWGVGLGVDNEEMRYKDNKNDIKIKALFDLQYQGKQFHINEDIMSYNFTHSNILAAEVIAASKNRGFKAKDNKTFNGMSTRDSSIDLGGRLIAKTGLGAVVLDVTKDVVASKGYEANLKIGGISPHAPHWTGKRNLNVAAMAGVRYQSKKVVDYYYGVKKKEVTATRNVYQGKSAITPFVGVEAQANITQHVSLKGSFGMSKTAKSIRNSPLANDKNYTAEARLGLTYWF